MAAWTGPILRTVHSLRAIVGVCAVAGQGWRAVRSWAEDVEMGQPRSGCLPFLGNRSDAVVERPQSSSVPRASSSVPVASCPVLPGPKDL